MEEESSSKTNSLIMGKITGFIEFERVDEKNKAVKDRLKNYKEFTVKLPEEELQKQGSTMYGLRYSILS